MIEGATSDPYHVTFVCVKNAGRSQIAYAIAEQERARRNATNQIELHTGGSEPANHVHEGVIDAMLERDIDLRDRTPREITFDEMQTVDLVITMGCSAEEVCPATWGGETRDWALDDPRGRSVEEVKSIRDKIERRVIDLFDELLADAPA